MRRLALVLVATSLAATAAQASAQSSARPRGGPGYAPRAAAGYAPRGPGYAAGGPGYAARAPGYAPRGPGYAPRGYMARPPGYARGPGYATRGYVVARPSTPPTTTPLPPASPPRPGVVPAPAPYPSARVRPVPAPYAGAPRGHPVPPPGYAHGGVYPYYPYYYPYAPYVPYAAYVPFVAPLWFGWGWGWGYYPLYPAPAPGMIPPQEPAASPERITTYLSVRGAWQDHGGMGGLNLGIEGRRVGFHASIDGISTDVLRDAGVGSSTWFGWGTTHLTFSLISEAAYRIRLELGGSMLSMPNSGVLVGRPYAGTYAFGPNFGASGHIGLLGPIGLEGHARYTPEPFQVSDIAGAVALRGGPLALTGGWRWFDVAGNGTEAPQLHFSGPEVGLSFLF